MFTSVLHNEMNSGCGGAGRQLLLYRHARMHSDGTKRETSSQVTLQLGLPTRKHQSARQEEESQGLAAEMRLAGRGVCMAVTLYHISILRNILLANNLQETHIIVTNYF